MTQRRSRKPIMSDMYRFTNSNDDDDDDDDEKHWYHIRSSSPPSSISINNNFSHQLSPTTIGSWGFDVNRSTNGQTLLSCTSNNNNNNDQHIITKTTKDYNEHLVDMSSSLSSQNFQLRTPTLTRHRNGNEFAAVDRLVLGPSRTIKSNHYPPDDSLPQQMILTNHSRRSSNNHRKIKAEQELIAWQNRMLDRDQQTAYQSPKLINKRNGFHSSQSSSRQIPSSVRAISAMSNMSESQYFEHDHHESTIKSARVIKRYIELLYHLQTYYEKITDQLYGGNSRDDLRILTKKSNTHVNVNNSNNNDTLTRLATVKSVKRDNKTQPNSILKPYPPTSSSKERKKNFDINTKVFKPNRVDIRDRLIDYDNDDQQLTTNEHIGIMKRKEEIRKMHSKQNIQTTNDQDFNDDYIRSQFNHRKFNKEHERDLMRQSLFHRIEASVSNF
ncbi:unnamed protein product [Rotaria sp. Silwood2]|nr:unnamed protein product [Rotaria sp. Silwood2]